MDSIVALATGPVNGALALLRLSGPLVDNLLSRAFKPSDPHPFPLPPRRVILGFWLDGDAQLDQVLVTYFPAPHSYTGETMAEISCHGANYIVARIQQVALAHGFRLALPGEFTRRAFLNHKLDLTQAEAVNDLIQAVSPLQLQNALAQLKGELSLQLKDLRQQLLHLHALLTLELDFAEEDVQFADRAALCQLVAQAQSKIQSLAASFKAGNAIKQGVSVAIVGPPNSGKSTLLNHILQEELAIVSNIPGTTRDAIEGTKNLQGLPFRFIDTAGFRDTSDPIESLGIQRTKEKLAQAAIGLIVVDASLLPRYALQNLQLTLAQLNPSTPAALVVSKCDIAEPASLNELKDLLCALSPSRPVLPWSAPDHRGLEEIENTLVSIAQTLLGHQGAYAISSPRHYAALCEADQAFTHLLQAMQSQLPTEILAFHLHNVEQALASITGEFSTDDVLDEVFSHFCIGK